MKSKMHKNKGYIALVATMLIVIGAVSAMVVTSIETYSYSDMLYRKGLRAQARQNLADCMATLDMMISRDFYLSGTTTLPQYGCVAHINNDFLGNATYTAISDLYGIKEYGSTKP